MTNKEAIEVIGQFSRIINNESWLPEAQKAIKEASALAIKALEVVDKIKKAYSANEEIEEIDDAMCFANATYDILCEAYGSDTDCESW